ncbi:fimbria/pilus outer membrane usher protein [Cupriavidus plantarum]|uniref:fimbria/pilus outer membrane usher protein n=1 Tax=Cupriavidus plantarum TaxID=942865 RepID=UPI000EAC644A|nr:fimbria/pilus outer membrane usher protein [Cupriavidus plantarum]RLK33510.1 outer membrane usher protein FimD/PapC [Cupriavidus plantarum]
MHHFPRAARSASAPALSAIALAVLALGGIHAAGAAEPASSPSLPPAGSPAASPGASQTDNTQFDLEMMKSRGIDPKVAEYFMQQARFTPGMTAVTLSVNGQRKGAAMARFDEKGQLCFDRRFLTRAGLRMPDDAEGASARGARRADGADRGVLDPAAPGGQCLGFRDAYPQTVVTLKPNAAVVELLVPTDALVPDAQAQADYTSGGTAALLNYDLLAVGNAFAGGSSKYYSAATEFGFNMGDWIVRNRNMYSNDGTTSTFSHLYAYAQRTFVSQQAVFQGGEINVANSIFPGPAIYGAQWMPEMALRRPASPGTAVEGIAQTQARVEVRQAGAVIYTTVVPPGPFTLTNIPLLNGSNDLEVTVIEATGVSRRFVVPAAQLGAGTLGVTPGYAFAVGKLRQLGNEPEAKPWMATATGTWQLGRNAGLTGGLMVGTQYQSAAAGVDARMFGTTNASLRGILSNATRESYRGAQFMGSISSQLGGSFSVNVTATQQTPGYRSITDTTQDTTQDWIDSHFRGQYTGGVAWSHEVLGAFSLNYSRSTLFAGDTTQRVTGSWGKSFKYATVSLSLEKALGGNTGTNGNSVYLSVSVPLGKRSVRGYVNRVDGSTRLGATYNEVVNDVFNYSLNAETRPGEGSASASANASVTPYYTRANVGVAQYGSDSTSYNAELSGGVLAHKQGVTFSPYAISDTFGVASLGSDLSGVKISTPQGPVWTDAWGRAVISTAPPYAQSRLEVATTSLPRNVDIGNAFMQINPGRGSVSYVNFDVVKVRRLLLHTTDAAGNPLPRNATVTDASGNFVTTVLNDGTIFLSNSVVGAGLQAVDQSGSACALEFTVPVTQDLEAYFDEVEARCMPLAKSTEGERK